MLVYSLIWFIYLDSCFREGSLMKTCKDAMAMILQAMMLFPNDYVRLASYQGDQLSSTIHKYSPLLFSSFRLKFYLPILKSPWMLMIVVMIWTIYYYKIMPSKFRWLHGLGNDKVCNIRETIKRELLYS